MRSRKKPTIPWCARVSLPARRIWLVGLVALGAVVPASAQPNLDQVHYRWRNDDGVESGNAPTQVSATVDDTTSSVSDVVVSNMTITPGPGDYHVFFSGSVEGNTGGTTQFVSLYLNGTQIPHTERRVFTESSIPDTSFPVATHARLTAVTAGQAIDVRWRTTSGTATMHERALVVVPINPADSSEVSATADDTTVSASDVVVAGMSITPGAGDYHVWFSGSVESDATSVQHVSLYLNGVQVPHTERQITTESSIPGTSFPVAMHARLTGVTAGQAIDVRWRTSAGTATMHERTLVVTRINPANSTEVSATADDVTASASDVLVSGMTVTPGAGDYLVWFSGSAESDATSVQNVSIYVNGVQLAHSERQITTESSIPSTSFPVATHAHVSGVGAGEPIEVRWRTSAANATMHERTLVVESVSSTSAATFSAAQDTKLTGLAKGATRRVRFEISNEGVSGSGAVQYALQVAETATCASGTYAFVPTTATDHWQVIGSTFITDGDATSNITPGLTDEGVTFVAGELKDASNTTGNVTLNVNEFTEIEFSVQATGLATDAGDYCFRLYDATNTQVLDTYTVYAEVRLAGPDDVTVSASGTQTASLPIPSASRYVGGKFVITTSSGFRNVTGITIAESGTVDAQNDLDDVQLFYELDTTAPYDGASETYDGSETQFGATDADGFSAANGTSSFTDSVPISTTSSLVVYVLLEVLPTASDGETVEASIDDPSTDVTVSAGTVGPGSAVALPGTTTLAAANDLTQIHYRWRNDDGGEGSTGGSTVDRQVGANSDDAEERVSTGGMELSSNLEMVDNEGDLQEVGYRFQNITVPNAATISNAYIQFTADDVDSGAISLTIYGEDVDSAPTFTTTNSDISSRTKTTASVLWTGIPDWTTAGASGPDQRTPDLTSIVQEIVDRPGWVSGQSMVFIFTGTGVRTARAHDTNPAQAAELHIEHSGGGGGAAWGAPEDTKIFGVTKGTIERVRFEISNEGVTSSGPVTYQLQVAEGAACSVGTYSAVPTAATGHWQIVDSTFFADGDPTTNVAPGLTDEASTFVPGEIKDAGNTTGAITLNSDEFTEIEFAVQATANAIDGQDYCFRLFDTTGGTVLDTYSIYAEAQLAGSTLVLGDHGAGQEVDKFTTLTPVTEELFAFSLTSVGTVTLTNLAVSFTTGGGVVDGDVTGGELWLDNNEDGALDAGDTLIQGGITGSGGQLSFTTSFSPGTSGSHYIVRATVANLVTADTTTLSLTTADITAGAATKTGSTTAVVHTQDAPPVQDVFYSVGTSTANLRTGIPNITILSGTATLDIAQTGNVGVGDVINFGAGTEVYIHQVTSQTEFEVRTVTGTMPLDAGPAVVNSIGRVFNSWQGAINNAGTGSYLGTFDLAGNDVRLTLVGYHDAPFNVSATTTVTGYTTDATRYVTLTAAGASQVASGVSQRHLGTPGGGVHLSLQIGTITGLRVQQAFTRVQWFDIDGTGSGLTNGIVVDGSGNDALFEFVLVYDVGSRGIDIGRDNVRLRNCVVYDTTNDGILIRASGVEVQSCTIFMAGTEGVEVQSPSTVTIENVISVGSGTSDFHNDGTATINNNLASDTTANAPAGTGGELGGVGNLDDRTPTDVASPGAGDWVIFVDIPGRDLHLQSSAENDALDTGKDLSGSFSADIDGGGRSTPWDIGADDQLATTAVKLVRLEALGLDGAVELQWETGSELDNLGFHVYRSESAGGPFTRLTGSPIPGLGSSPVGARYRYRDEGLANGVTVYYELEDIHTAGATTRHGPVWATPYAGAALAEGAGEETAGSPSRITYGEPGANGLRVLRAGRNFVVLELTTAGFYARPEEDGTVTLEVPGFDAIGDVGAPSIPVRHHWVEAVAGRRVELTSVRGRMESVAGGWLLATEVAELMARPSGTVRPGRRRMGVRARGLFPSEPARVVTVAFQGETKKALVELSPLRWSSATGELYLARRLVVRLSFQSVDTSELRLSGNRGRRRARRFERSHGVLARLATTERGLYGVRYEDVFGEGGRLPVSSLRLSRQGEAVAFHVDGRTFEPGSVLYFVSAGAEANPYGNEAVYELQLSRRDVPGLEMERVDAAASGAAPSYYWKRVDAEEDRYYQAALLDAPDVWLWDLLLAPVTKSYPFEVTALAATVEPSRLDVWLQGTSDTPAFPDHHVRVYVNGTLVVEGSRNGKSSRRLSAELGPGLLVEGPNVLELENVGDTEASYSTVMLDRFRVEHPRPLAAEWGVLEGRFSESGTATVEGVGTDANVVELGDAPRWLGRGTSFAVEAGRSYLVVDPGAVRTPEVRRPSPTSLTSRENRADYVVVGPRAFVEAATPLLIHRAEQGLVAQGVALEDVFAEFGHGERSPEALRDFLEYAYHEWRAPSPRYVVLLGDGSYDYKDYGKLGTDNPVPPLMVKTSYLWTASDPAFAAVNGDDLLPDVAIGRLPAASVDDVHRLVEKILLWETNGHAFSEGPVVLVADNRDAAGNFSRDAEEAARRLPPDMEVHRIYLGELGASTTKQAVLDAFDAGASLMSYIGHGGIHLWADENIFNTGKLGALALQEHQPILLTMNCLNGYFHFPYFGSLAEELVKADGKGVIAAFSPSGLSLNAPAQKLHHAILDELGSGHHPRLGDAVLRAQERYLDTGAFPELLAIYHLFGDPALTIR